MTGTLRGPPPRAAGSGVPRRVLRGCPVDAGHRTRDGGTRRARYCGGERSSRPGTRPRAGCRRVDAGAADGGRQPVARPGQRRRRPGAGDDGLGQPLGARGRDRGRHGGPGDLAVPAAPGGLGDRGDRPLLELRRAVRVVVGVRPGPHAAAAADRLRGLDRGAGRGVPAGRAAARAAALPDRSADGRALAGRERRGHRDGVCPAGAAALRADLGAQRRGVPAADRHRGTRGADPR